MELIIKKYKITGNLIPRSELLKISGYKSINGLNKVLSKIGFPKPYAIVEDALQNKVFYRVEDIIAFNRAHPDKVIFNIKEAE